MNVNFKVQNDFDDSDENTPTQVKKSLDDTEHSDELSATNVGHHVGRVIGRKGKGKGDGEMDVKSMFNDLTPAQKTQFKAFANKAFKKLSSDEGMAKVKKFLDDHLTYYQRYQLWNFMNSTSKNGVSPLTILELLKPLDFTSPQLDEFFKKIKGIQIDDLIELTKKTGIQLNYPVLVPVIMEQFREKNNPVDPKDLEKLRKGVIKARDEINLKPNYLVEFMSQLHNEMTKYQHERTTVTYKAKRFVSNNWLVLLVAMTVIGLVLAQQYPGNVNFTKYVPAFGKSFAKNINPQLIKTTFAAVAVLGIMVASQPYVK